MVRGTARNRKLMQVTKNVKTRISAKLYDGFADTGIQNLQKGSYSMNISRLDVVRAIPADDLADFSEAIADAAHYLANALASIPSDDAIDAKASELWKALEILNSYSNFADRQRKQSEESLDFSGIEKAIAAEKKSAKAKKNKKPEFFGHAKALRMIKQQAKKAEARSEADDNAGDKALQEAYDIDPTDTEQLATELMRGCH